MQLNLINSLVLKKTTKIPLKDQIRLLKKYYSESILIPNKNKGFTWEGELKSSPMGDSYTIKIVYEIGSKPKTYIINPLKLSLPQNEKRLKHVYSHNLQELCLYYPKDKEWHEGKMIASTIIPWAIEWLHHYEIWLITGEWHGGGVEHGNSKK